MERERKNVCERESDHIFMSNRFSWCLSLRHYAVIEYLHVVLYVQINFIEIKFIYVLEIFRWQAYLNVLKITEMIGERYRTYGFYPRKTIFETG